LGQIHHGYLKFDDSFAGKDVLSGDKMRMSTCHWFWISHTCISPIFPLFSIKRKILNGIAGRSENYRFHDFMKIVVAIMELFIVYTPW